MNTHPGRHKEQPCIHEHSYYCANCGELFATDGDTHWRHPTSGKVYPCLYWPACSFTCYSRNHVWTQRPPDTAVLDLALERGDTSSLELEALYDYISPIDEFVEDIIEEDEGVI